MSLDTILRMGERSRFLRSKSRTRLYALVVAACLAVVGASLVGMSTVLEAIVARYLGARVLGISVVTNLAAGLSAEPLSHDEVAAAGRGAAARLERLLAGVIAKLA